MLTLLRSPLRFIAKHLLSFAIVVVLLLVGRWVYAEWEKLARIERTLPILIQAESLAKTYWNNSSEQALHQMVQLQNATVADLETRLKEIDRNIQAKEANRPPLTTILSTDQTLAAGLAAHLEHSIDIELLKQQRIYLKALRDFAAAAGNKQGAHAKLRQLEQAHVAIHQALQRNYQQQRQLKQAHPIATKLPWTAAYKQLKALEQSGTTLELRNEQAYRDYLTQQQLVDRLPTLERPGMFRVDAERLTPVLQPLQQHIGYVTNRLSQHWIDQARQASAEVAPTALGIVLTACLLPVALKLLFYFVLAPLAARRPPVYLETHHSATAQPPPIASLNGTVTGSVSAVSQAVLLGPDQELLIVPEYVQSLPTGSRKDTQWLLDRSCPLTSLAAGLFALTRVRVDQPETVTVAAMNDPLDEIALLNLPEGAALVLQPRSVVGAVYRRGTPLRITRHWRLGSLHAWLTLQLRYLVFHGPATLMVRGCRGVRVEPAGNGHTISQWTTLGFSPHLAYSTRRCEPFIPYLSGRQALLFDHFEGQTGWFVHEVMPRAGRNNKAPERWLEGGTDAVLKAFGV